MGCCNSKEKENPEDPLKHEGWKDLREKSRWCTDVFFLVSY
jgi:hypothetical protein